MTEQFLRQQQKEQQRLGNISKVSQKTFLFSFAFLEHESDY